MTRATHHRRLAIGLAIAATTTATCISILAGYQRGGWLSERILWVALSVVLVASAHLLPALCRPAAPATRLASGALWLGCMLATCYGHATFFLMAQRHAAEHRAETVSPSVAAPVVVSSRSLTQIAAERAHVVTALAAAKTRRCARDCSSVRLERVSLAARLDALTIEAREAQRQEAEADRATAALDQAEKHRAAARIDPVTSRVATFLGAPAERIDLLSSLAFATVLEGVACLLWVVALGEQAGEYGIIQSAEPPPRVTLPEPEPAPVATSHDAVTDTDSAGSPDSEVTRLTSDIAAGRVRATVADIRRHLGCSQSRAMALRRQLTAEPSLGSKICNPCVAR